ncbi:MAG: FtsX-like permease family protein [Culicoidibacterales bacterium]
MYVKMAWNNVRKSTRDYAIYFLTLTLGICLFYAFNAISDQTALTQISERQAEYVALLQFLMEILSLVISCVLGALIIYANNFLVKRRKRELGLYGSLGMNKWHVALVLTIETLLVGLGSLLVGLLFGVIISQVLSTLATQLFLVPLTAYRFLWSPRAAGVTFVAFGLIFFIVLLFNSIVMMRYSLHELLSANRENERIKQPRLMIVTLISLLAISCLAFAYWLAMKIGLDPNNPYFWLPIGCGVLGTFAFFWSFASWFAVGAQKFPHQYLSGVRMFTFRQIYSKVKTNYISTTIICLLLFLTVGALATSFGFKTALERTLIAQTPVDASASYYAYDGTTNHDLQEMITQAGFVFQPGDQVYQFSEYGTVTNVVELLKEQAIVASEKAYLAKPYQISDPYLYSERDYNAILAMTGREPITLAENQVLLLGDIPAIENTFAQFVSQQQTIKLGTQNFELINATQKTPLQPLTLSTQMAVYSYALIVPERALQQENVYQLKERVNINVIDNHEQTRLKELDHAFYEFQNQAEQFSAGYFSGITRLGLIQESTGFTNVILFIGLYLSFIFMLASVAILALQQLTEIVDSLPRYKTLQRLGLEETMFKRSVATQVSVHFLLPLGLALIHAIVGIRIVQSYLIELGKPDLLAGALFTAAVFAIFYGGYALTTYAICSRQIREYCE